MVAEKKLNDCFGLSRTVHATDFALFANKSTLKLGGRYGQGGY